MGRKYGAPQRLHIGGWSITLLANNRRSRRLWGNAWAEGRAYRRDSATGKLTNIHGEEASWRRERELE